MKEKLELLFWWEKNLVLSGHLLHIKSWNKRANTAASVKFFERKDRYSIDYSRFANIEDSSEEEPGNPEQYYNYFEGGGFKDPFESKFEKQIFFLNQNIRNLEGASFG